MKAWIAQDESGSVFCYINRKPHKERNIWKNGISPISLFGYEIPEGLAPQWEDEEPIKVELTIKKV